MVQLLALPLSRRVELRHRQMTSWLLWSSLPIRRPLPARPTPRLVGLSCLRRPRGMGQRASPRSLYSVNVREPVRRMSQSTALAIIAAPVCTLSKGALRQAMPGRSERATGRIAAMARCLASRRHQTIASSWLYVEQHEMPIALPHSRPGRTLISPISRSGATIPETLEQAVGMALRWARKPQPVIPAAPLLPSPSRSSGAASRLRLGHLK